MTCPVCGRANEPEARFCAACGTRLARTSMAPEARKVVTVFFTDVAESTVLGEQLDPELLRRVMWRYFDVVQGVLERHGGTVEKFVGDAVMAVFGVPVVHEDDALRAVRAAAEIGDALRLLGDELAREHGIRLATRTGLNTGEVIVGGGAPDQKLATGDAVNVAAR
ncbi:MAG TPA: adenylate/guanylate cyclase domain-containing protein, partial [Gaiella sp.]